MHFNFFILAYLFITKSSHANISLALFLARSAFIINCSTILRITINSFLFIFSTHNAQSNTRNKYNNISNCHQSPESIIMIQENIIRNSHNSIFIINLNFFINIIFHKIFNNSLHRNKINSLIITQNNFRTNRFTGIQSQIKALILNTIEYFRRLYLVFINQIIINLDIMLKENLCTTLSQYIKNFFIRAPMHLISNASFN